MPETPVPAPDSWEPRRAYRVSDGAFLGGVAGGLAVHLRVDPLWVRAFFVLSSAIGFGVVLYAALWLVLPLAPQSEPATPGLAAASRQGRRPRSGARLTEPGPLVAIAVLGLGLVLLVGGRIFDPVSLLPIAVALVGLAVLWRQADETQRERWRDAGGRLDVRRVFLGDGGTASWARLLSGLGLMVAALVLFAAQTGRLAVARDVLLAGTLGVIGLALMLGPWVVRLVAELGAEREERVRSQERADVAAHLHDSVLQTLALIQKNAADPQQVARLARAQERDLRQWMYAAAPAAEESLAAALRAAAADVEDTHGVPVEVVTVGDLPASDEVAGLVLAAREAMVNAAKHSRAARIDVFAEAEGDAAEVFVRDRGVGFDPSSVPEDRLGLRGSIVDRMERYGGVATVRSAPGEGTEVRLRLGRRSEPAGTRRDA